MKVLPARADNRAILPESGVHRIEDDLVDSWLESFVAEGLDEVEAYLRKHADFQSFLEDRDKLASGSGASPGRAMAGRPWSLGEAEGLLEHAFGLCAEGGRLGLSALEEDHRGDAHDPEALRQLGLLVDVHLDEPELIRSLLGDLVEDRRDRVTGAAPLRPEIDEHRLFAFDDFLLKRGFRDGVCHAY